MATIYHNIVFLLGEEAKEPLKILEEQGIERVFAYLHQWDNGIESEYDPRTEPPWGSSDRTFEVGDYIVSYNTRIGYIGLTRKGAPQSEP